MMKKMILLLCATVLLCGCGKGTITIEKTIETKKTEEEVESRSLLKNVNGYYQDVYYDADTKVMYYKSRYGHITPLYNADGSLRTYDGE